MSDFKVLRINSLFWLLLPTLLTSVAAFKEIITNWHELQPLVNDPDGNVLGKDYKIFWMASRLVLDGMLEGIYSVVGFENHLKETFETYQNSRWAYPPTYLLLAYPLALFDYSTSYFVYIAFSVIFFTTVCVGRNKLSSFGAMIVILSQVSIYCLFFGQNGIFFAAVIFAAVYARDKNKFLAGLFTALVMVSKPQIGFMLPLLLLVKKDWQSFIWMVISGISLGALSVLCFGIGVWQAYLGNITGAQTSLIYGDGGVTIITLFTAMRALIPDNFFYIAFGAIALIAIYVAVKTWLNNEDYRVNLLALSFVTFVVSPYYLPYDFVIVVLASTLIWPLITDKKFIFTNLLIWLLPIVLLYSISYFESSEIIYLKVYISYVCTTLLVAFLTYGKFKPEITEQ